MFCRTLSGSKITPPCSRPDCLTTGCAANMANHGGLAPWQRAQKTLNSPRALPKNAPRLTTRERP